MSWFVKLQLTAAKAEATSGSVNGMNSRTIVTDNHIQANVAQLKPEKEVRFKIVMASRDHQLQIDGSRHKHDDVQTMQPVSRNRPIREKEIGHLPGFYGAVFGCHASAI